MCNGHVCYQDAQTAPEVLPLLHRRPQSNCLRILETRFLDLREVDKLRNLIYLEILSSMTKIHIIISFFWNDVSKNIWVLLLDHFSVVKWYRQVQQNGFPDLLCQFSLDVLVHLPHHLRCCCGWSCLSQIDNI